MERCQERRNVYAGGDYIGTYPCKEPAFHEGLCRHHFRLFGTTPPPHGYCHLCGIPLLATDDVMAKECERCQNIAAKRAEAIAKLEEPMPDEAVNGLLAWNERMPSSETEEFVDTVRHLRGKSVHWKGRLCERQIDPAILARYRSTDDVLEELRKQKEGAE